MGNCCEIEKKEPEIEINKINLNETPILIYEKEETPKSEKNIIFNIENNFETNEKEETSTSNNLKSKKNEKNKNYLNNSNFSEELFNIDFQIFNIINEMRMNPKKFLNESFKYKLNHIFENIISNQKKMNKLNFPKEHLNEINNYLKDLKNIDKNLKAKENDIIKILGNKIDKKNYFQSISSKEEAKENVWNLLENFDDEDYVILTEPFENLIVISVPLDGTNKIITSYIFFNQNKF